jgi:beta-lactamase class A
MMQSASLKPPSRRTILTWLGCALATGTKAQPAARTPPGEPFEAIEQAHGGRLGVYVLDTGSLRSLGYRADERFLMCSTFKLLLAACVLSRVEAGQEQLGRVVRYGPRDLMEYAPVARAHLAEGGLQVEALCQAAVEVSDNTAANLLLAAIGGPAAVTRFAREHGDGVTRLDRWELALNVPSGALDTSTPHAMTHLLATVLLGPALGAASRAKLEAWMQACSTGGQRIRAGLPAGWVAGDKTGTGHTQTNDLAIIRPPGRAPILVTAYYEAGTPPDTEREAVLRQVGAAVARWVA